MSDENFKFRCMHCDRKLKAPIDLAGERIRCPHCNKPIRIPDPAEVEEETKSRQLQSMNQQSQPVNRMNATKSPIEFSLTDALGKTQVDMDEADTDAIDTQEDVPKPKSEVESKPRKKLKSKVIKKKKSFTLKKRK